MEIIDIHTNVKGAVDEAIARAVAIAGLAGIAVIHVLQLPDAFEAAGYLGALFVCAVTVSVLLAAALTRRDDERLWGAAGGLAALILLGYVVSRSVGLPGFTEDVGEWTEPAGLASMVAESLVACVSAATLVARHPVRLSTTSPSRTPRTRSAPRARLSAPPRSSR
jgi:hypothetical protein